MEKWADARVADVFKLAIIVGHRRPPNAVNLVEILIIVSPFFMLLGSVSEDFGLKIYFNLLLSFGRLTGPTDPSGMT